MKLMIRKDLTPEKIEAKKIIDKAAEVERRKLITFGAGQALVYQAKVQEAVEFIKTAAIGPFLEAEMETSGNSASSVSGEWVERDEEWRKGAARIEKVRLRAKKSVNDATSPAEIAAALEIDWSAA